MTTDSTAIAMTADSNVTATKTNNTMIVVTSDSNVTVVNSGCNRQHCDSNAGNSDKAAEGTININ